MRAADVAPNATSTRPTQWAVNGLIEYVLLAPMVHRFASDVAQPACQVAPRPRRSQVPREGIRRLLQAPPKYDEWPPNRQQRNTN